MRLKSSEMSNIVWLNGFKQKLIETLTREEYQEMWLCPHLASLCFYNWAWNQFGILKKWLFAQIFKLDHSNKILKPSNSTKSVQLNLFYMCWSDPKFLQGEIQMVFSWSEDQKKDGESSHDTQRKQQQQPP